MIGLPAKFRIKVHNGTGVAIAANDLNVKVCLQKFDGSGAATESPVQTLYSNAGSLATATYEAGAWFDNTTAHWIGFHGLVYSNVTGAPAGTIKVFLENTTDPDASPGDSPTDGRGWMLVEIAYAAAGASTRPIKV